MSAQTVTYSQELPITDADGKPVIYRKVIPICAIDGSGIFPGSVLEHIEDKERGVVVKVYKAGDWSILGVACEGDLAIETTRGTTRITNQYSKWRHVPHAEQTYDQRFRSWLARPYLHDEYKQSSADEGLAIDGIMALLPEDAVDWEYGPWPDRLDDALKFLTDHLTKLSTTPTP